MKKIDRHKRDIILLRILSDDLEQSQKTLKAQRKSLSEIYKKNPALQTVEEISSINHVIGYLTGHIVALERTISWMGFTAEELTQMLKEAKEIEEQNKRMMQELFEDIKKDKKSGKKKR